MAILHDLTDCAGKIRSRHEELARPDGRCQSGAPAVSARAALNLVITRCQKSVQRGHQGSPPRTANRDHHGKRFVVIAAEECKPLQRKAPNFAGHLLAMPTDDGGFERLRGSLRETNLQCTCLTPTLDRNCVDGGETEMSLLGSAMFLPLSCSLPW